MRGLLIPLLFFIILILAVVFGDSLISDNHDPDSTPESPPLLPTPKHETAIVAAPDGTVYLVEIGSGKVLWSFSSGTSTYSSYQQIPYREGEKLNSSAEGDDFYIDCGDDWELYLHGKGVEKVKLPVSVEEFVKRTPYVSTGGGVMLGSKKTAVFLVDAETGKVVRTFRTDSLPSSGESDTDQNSVLTQTDVEEWLPSSSVAMEDIEKPLYVTRTDYALTYTSIKTGKVLWYLMFADIEASFQCDGVDLFLGQSGNENKFRTEKGSDMKPQIHCNTRPVVYRIRDYTSLEPLFINNKLPDALPGSVVLSLPASDHHVMNHLGNSLAHPYSGKEIMMFPQGPTNKILDHDYSTDGKSILALPTPERKEINMLYADSGTPQIGGHAGPNSSVQPHFWPFMIYSALVPLAVTFLYLVRRPFLRGLSKHPKQSEHLKLSNINPRKKKGRKSVVTNQSLVVSRRHEEISESGSVRILEGVNISETGHVLSTLETYDNNGDSVDGRKIGKLIVTKNEIAKGSNGTIVLEGNYDGRPVAVKRLVRSHHNVADKEIQNLIASDQHPNIVRWHGVERDQDFDYLCLERCTCSLHDLILYCSSENEVAITDGVRESLGYNLQFTRTLGSSKELELWTPDGYPSPRLLKLMRDIVCGLAHLHEIGIIHRDLKPQNVLVVKDRLISAKISDMGISKHLDSELSSLTKHATGYGSSGWQAPEQLRRERQTRAVDLFSLGCILFFCITGGKHPFGESLERDFNIVNDRKDLFLIDHIPEATDLISRLLDPNPELRPKAIEVMHHPLFWNSEMRLSFLRDASDRVELEDREQGSQLLEALESRGRAAVGGKWDEKMDSAFINDIGRFRRYKFDSVRDLLRVIRNKLNHYRELSKEIQSILGPVPEGFDSYFSTRFPQLLIEVYHVIVGHCADEKIFHKYLTGT